MWKRLFQEIGAKKTKTDKITKRSGLWSAYQNVSDL
jgi:hypothetical protein